VPVLPGGFPLGGGVPAGVGLGVVGVGDGVPAGVGLGVVGVGDGVPAGLGVVGVGVVILPLPPPLNKLLILPTAFCPRSVATFIGFGIFPSCRIIACPGPVFATHLLTFAALLIFPGPGPITSAAKPPGTPTLPLCIIPPGTIGVGADTLSLLLGSGIVSPLLADFIAAAVLAGFTGLK